METHRNSPVERGEQREESPCVELNLPAAQYEPKLPVNADTSAEAAQPASGSGPQDSKSSWVAEPFQPVLDILGQLDRDDPKLAAQAARLVGLYHRLWESSVSKHLDSQRLQEANHELRAINLQLCRERETLEHRYEDQGALLTYFQQGLEKARQGIVDVLRNWGNPSDFLGDGAFTTL